MYQIKELTGYTIRESSVDPYKIPEPIPQDKEELASLLEASFPNEPQIAAGARKFGPSAFRDVATKQSAMDLFQVNEETATKLISVLRAGQFIFAPPVGSVPLIRSIEDVAKECSNLTNELQEHMVVLLVNKNYQLAHRQTIAIGHAAGINASISDVLQPSMERKINSFVLVHNHPSGDPAPSSDDLFFSQKVLQAAAMFNIELLDHVIVAKNGFSSALLK